MYMYNGNAVITVRHSTTIDCPFCWINDARRMREMKVIYKAKR